MPKFKTEIEIDSPTKPDDGLLTLTVKGKPEDVVNLLAHGMTREQLSKVYEGLNAQFGLAVTEAGK